MVGLTESLIYAWFDRSQIEYRDSFIRLYIAYNAWYRKVTGKSNDYEAISLLKHRFVIWDEYIQGYSLAALQQVMARIVVATNNRPIAVQSGYWSGVVKDCGDWRGLIHFWYEVRCSLFHGSTYAVKNTLEVQLAYESLYIFMNEIVARMRSSFRTSDYRRLEELRILVKGDRQSIDEYIQESILLHQKYITSPELWNVDMKRTS